MPLPRSVHLASIVLPASGLPLAASDTIPAGTPAYPNGPAPVADQVTRLLFELIYTPASGTGAPKVWVESSTEGGAVGRRLAFDPDLVIAGDTATRLAYFEEIKLPVSPAGAGVAWTYHIPYPVDRGLAGARLVVAEYGDDANPGTVQAFVTGGYGS